MKLKRTPEDFQVIEHLDPAVLEASRGRGDGPYRLYRLRKQSIGTPEALQAIARHWNLSRHQLAAGGLKDRHARTVQHVTVRGGPGEPIRERSFELEYLGRTDRAIEARWIAANEFVITLRNVARSSAAAFEARLAAIQRWGLVNYFDDQRFGSLGSSGEWIGAAWCRDDFERTLFLILAEPNTHDVPREAEQKRLLRDHWGDWTTLKSRLDRSHRRSVVTYLVDHPTDFRRAVALVRQDLRSIYAAAFQSAVWNRWLSSILAERLPADCRVVRESMSGPLVHPQLRPADAAHRVAPGAEDAPDADRAAAGVKAEQADAPELPDRLPLPSGRVAKDDLPFRPQLDSVLAEFGLTLEKMRFKYPRDTFFSKSDRDVWLRPRELAWEWLPDELYPGRRAVRLRFFLPRGAYATAVVKELQGGLPTAS